MMKLQQILIFLVVASCSKAVVDKSGYINPTGIYKHKAHTQNDTLHGDKGVIQVHSVGKNKIILNLYVNRGAPSYSSGSAFDTLAYRNNNAVYKPTEVDPSCEITFEFYKKGVMVVENADNYNAGCGFGHAVVAGGIFEKTSSKEPVFTNYATGQKMK